MPKFLWQQAEGKRHAYKTDRALPPYPGIAFITLCGAEVTPQKRDFVELSGWWLDPTCWHCDREWRIRCGFPPHEIPPLPENA